MNEPDCPRCGETMMLRVGRRGPFWGCPNYPVCTITIDAIGEDDTHKRDDGFERRRYEGRNE